MNAVTAAPNSPARGHDRQDDVRGATLVEEQRVARDVAREPGAIRRAGVWVHVEVRKIAGRHVDADLVAALKQIRGRERLDLHGGDLAGVQQLRSLPGAAI